MSKEEDIDTLSTGPYLQQISMETDAEIECMLENITKGRGEDSTAARESLLKLFLYRNTLEKNQRKKECELLRIKIGSLTYKLESDPEREQYRRTNAVLTLRLYVEQLRRKFREESKMPRKEQMIRDLQSVNENVTSPNISIEYIEWLWLLKCSSYRPARDLRKMAKKNFGKTTDFVVLLSLLSSEVSHTMRYPPDMLTLKLGLKALGLDSKRMEVAVETLHHDPFPLKKTSSKKKRYVNTNSLPALKAQPRKRVKLDRSKFRSQSDTDSSSA
ncbi:uncharacterized protein LOC135848309 [Planococcus citri]|uniref:uncharacterized protein LOC135848309 n=1 Tax=Planococcus citri TaxID=170843 RepID=UPI0031F8069C